MLALKNINAIHQRGEDLTVMLGGKNKHHESGFDIVIARALTALDKFLRMGKPLLNKDGTLVAMKGKSVEREIKSNYDLFESLNLKIDKIVHITLPYLKIERNLIFIKNNFS